MFVGGCCCCCCCCCHHLGSVVMPLSLLACLLHMYVSHHTPQCCQFDHTHDMKKMNLTLNYKPLFVVCGMDGEEPCDHK
ncbi:hypothetical protein CY35_01G072700 [Sphagnum magellanicum]|nr:hypothetical protein CY35_01G072700 [Sphagnum magellanicum]